MKISRIYTLAASIAICAGTVTAIAQENQKPAYLNPGLPPEQRAADLVHRMTLEEKASQLVNQARAIPRLNIPAYDWWSESLHGVAANGTTEFPEPIGLAATFDAPAIHKMADRHRHRRPHQARAGRPRRRTATSSKASTSGRPTSTSSAIRAGAAARKPTAKTRSSPRRMGVAFVTGMQGDDPQLLPRHLHAQTFRRAQRPRVHAPHSRRRRQQARRARHLSARLPRRRHRGQSRLRHVRLQQHQRRARLRQPVSARGSAPRQMGIQRLRRLRLRRRHRHLQRPPLQAHAAEASAISLQRGMDNECVDFSDQGQRRSRLQAVSRRRESRACSKRARSTPPLTRLFTARMQARHVRSAGDGSLHRKIDENVLDSAAHRALARKMANESMVLLKNDGILPLKDPGPA